MSKLIATASRDSKWASILRTYRLCEIFYPSVGSNKRTSSVFVLYKKFLNLEESCHRRLDHKNSEIVAGLILPPKLFIIETKLWFRILRFNNHICSEEVLRCIFTWSRLFLFSIQKLSYYDFGFYGNMYEFCKEGRALVLCTL